MSGMMSDVIVVVDDEERASSVIGAVCGLNGVVNTRSNEGVIECSLPSMNVAMLRSVPGVHYVRQVQSYLCCTD